MNNISGDCNNAKNNYLAVKHDIERRIITEEYPTLSQIPTLVELQALYGIGRSTAQKVIESLAEDGIILRKTRKGCFVKPYVRDKLMGKHMDLIRAAFHEVLQSSVECGLTATEINEIVVEELGKISMEEKAVST